jgi:hypothetical protein
MFSTFKHSNKLLQTLHMLTCTRFIFYYFIPSLCSYINIESSLYTTGFRPSSGKNVIQNRILSSLNCSCGDAYWT